MPYQRHQRLRRRRTDPLYRTLTYVDRRGGLIDEASQRMVRREAERAPRGRR